MATKLLYRFLSSGILLLLLMGVAQKTVAQSTDTTKTTKEVELKERSIPQPYHSERSANGFLLKESGTYGVPEPTEYYQPPFNGQKSLDRAMALYHKELDNSIANTAFFQLLGKIAPFIMNRFEFGFYRINDMPIVERDHPLLHPQLEDKKKEK